MSETNDEIVAWMQQWCRTNGAQLVLEGEVGFSRLCVGVLAAGRYPDYQWYDADWERIDNNGAVWTPEDAYHKYPCVAVLGRGAGVERQLYAWLRWFDDNGFRLVVNPDGEDGGMTLMKLAGIRGTARMVRRGE